MSALERLFVRAVGNARTRWPLGVACAVLWGITGWLLVVSLRFNDGEFTYALDDPYIHLAIARNVAHHQVWGVSSHEFSAASSSLSWTLLLAGCARFAPLLMVPFVLNLLFASAILAWFDRLLRLRFSSVPALWRAMALLSAVLFVPMPALVFVGMEHLLHAAICLAFAWCAAHWLRREPCLSQNQSRGAALPVTLAMLLTATRYEGLFVVFAVAIALAWRRRFALSLATGFAAAFPIAVFGWFSLQQGWYFLPNSVLLKGNSLDLRSGTAILSFITRVPRTALATPAIAALLLLAIWLWLRGGRPENEAGGQNEERQHSRIFAALFIAATLLHLQFAAVGWFYRYEAYLIVWGAVAVVTLLAVAPRAPADRHRPQAMKQSVVLAVALPLVAGCFPLLQRGLSALQQTPFATMNIHQQQSQMARFVSRFYADSAIAANDIGYIHYAADVRCLDLWGLSSIEIARALRAHKFSPALIAQLARRKNVQAALVYGGWFRESHAPPGWIRVGQWRIAHNVVNADNIVAFYATSPAQVPRLRRALQQFAPSLPRSVQYSEAP